MRGRFLLAFRHPGDPGRQIELRLEQEGDYALWREDVAHTWRAEADSVVVSVRWEGDRADRMMFDRR